MKLFIAALLPIVIVVVLIYYLDKHDKEPRGLLFKHFILGAVVSIIITTIIYVAFDYVMPLPDNFSVLQQFIKAFIVVALTEEFSKYVIVRYVGQPHKEFNEPYDGIAYAVMVSMGFAATENILYVLDGGMGTAVVRAFTAVPAHATFGILMGFYMGKAKFAKNRIALNLKGLALAVLFHGAYDFFLFIEFIPGIWIGAFVSLIVAIILSIKAIKIHRSHD